MASPVIPVTGLCGCTLLGDKGTNTACCVSNESQSAIRDEFQRRKFQSSPEGKKMKYVRLALEGNKIRPHELWLPGIVYGPLYGARCGDGFDEASEKGFASLVSRLYCLL